MICVRMPLLTMLAIICSSFHGGQISKSQELTIRSTSPLVLVDLTARDKTTGKLIGSLSKDDLKLADNGIFVPIESFDRSPRTIWFVMICNQLNWLNQGSTFFAGKSHTFRSALERLGSGDKIAVAHWCDIGCATIDLMPTADAEAALAVIENVLKRPATLPVGTITGEFALQQLMRFISDVTHETKPKTTPVIVFIHGGAMGMRKSEAKRIAEDLSEISAIVFGINNGKYSPFKLGEIVQLNEYWSRETGGRVFSMPDEDYERALQEVIEQGQMRYQLGFTPRNLDSRWHKIHLELAEKAKEKFNSLSLSYRAGYMASSEQGSPTGLISLPVETSPLSGEKVLPSNANRILFKANAISNSAELHCAAIQFQIDSNTVYWPAKKLTLMILITFLSTNNHILGYMPRSVEVQKPGRNSTYIRFQIVVDLSPDTKRVRLAIKQDESGRVGAVEIPRMITEK